MMAYPTIHSRIPIQYASNDYLLTKSCKFFDLIRVTLKPSKKKSKLKSIRV